MDMHTLDHVALAMQRRKGGELGLFQCVTGRVRELPTVVDVCEGQIVAIDCGIVRAASPDECRAYWYSQGYTV